MNPRYTSDLLGVINYNFCAAESLAVMTEGFVIRDSGWYREGTGSCALTT